MTELELFVDFHKDAERQGPGSSFETIKALNFININKKHILKIADIGCGSGGQTITLAQNIRGKWILTSWIFYFVTKQLDR